jgi:hypothetical protein
MVDKMNSKYIKGRKFENEVKKDYALRGHYCVRAAGSKGLIDLVCIKNYWVDDCGTVVIQCKVGNNPPKPSREFKAFPIAARKVWCTKKNRQQGFSEVIV